MINVRLKIPLDEFKKKLLEFIHINIDLQNIIVVNEPKFADYQLKIDEWKNQLYEFFISSCEDPDLFFWDVVHSNENFLSENNHRVSTSFHDKLRKIKSSLFKLEKKLLNLEKMIKTLDVVLGKSPIIDTANYSIEDLIFLILSKLREIKSENYYPVSILIAGNGIVLKRGDAELKEIIQEINRLRYVEIDVKDFAQITIKGERYLEKFDRKKIKGEADDLSKTIIILIDELRIMGYSNQKLSDELREIKELYPKLSKKNWSEIVKGKLIDLTVDKVIDSEIAKSIWIKLLPNLGVNFLLNG